ncbi:hypothetical protein CFOL_v3_30284, partial [Cephalotus follicularis]
GGLALLWSDDVKVEIKSFSNNHIDAMIEGVGGGCRWKATGIYGHPVHHRKKETWDFLRELGSVNMGPWLCYREFNEILDNGRRRGVVLELRDILKFICKPLMDVG